MRRRERVLGFGARARTDELEVGANTLELLHAPVAHRARPVGHERGGVFGVGQLLLDHLRGQAFGHTNRVRQRAPPRAPRARVTCSTTPWSRSLSDMKLVAMAPKDDIKLSDSAPPRRVILQRARAASREDEKQPLPGLPADRAARLLFRASARARARGRAATPSSERRERNDRRQGGRRSAPGERDALRDRALPLLRHAMRDRGSARRADRVARERRQAGASREGGW